MPTILLPAYSDDGPDAALVDLDASAVGRILDWLAKAETLAASGVRGLLCEMPCAIRFVHTSAEGLEEHVEGPFSGGEPVVLPQVVCELSGLSEVEGERTEWDTLRVDRGTVCFETQIKHGSLASTADMTAAFLRSLLAFTRAGEAAL